VAKFKCPCGEIIRMSGDIPNSEEWLFISDQDFDAVEAAGDPIERYLSFKSLFRCSGCGRVWIFWDGFEAEPTQYVPR